MDIVAASDRDSLLAFGSTTTTIVAVPDSTCEFCAGGVVLEIREEDIVVVFLVLVYLLHREGNRGAVKAVKVGDEGLLRLRR
jgi:hypothetical protein